MLVYFAQSAHFCVNKQTHILTDTPITLPLVRASRVRGNYIAMPTLLINNLNLRDIGTTSLYRTDAGLAPSVSVTQRFYCISFYVYGTMQLYLSESV